MNFSQEIKSIRVECPICHEKFIININMRIIYESKNFPVAFVVEHDNRTLIAYIDSDFKIRGIKPVFSLIKKVEASNSQKEELRISSTSELLKNMSIEERTIYCCNSTCENFQKSNIPNVIEKQVLNLILKHKEVTLAFMLSNLSILEKALNRKIDEKLILQILEKYIEEGLIFRHIMKTDEEFKIYDSIPSELP